MGHIGSFATNLHEGSRSEYLANFFFAAFGTAVAIPHQEDSGLDLICTIAEKKGRRSWPKYSYAVQVKSNYKPWVFDSEESVNWFLKYPSPLFLCIVDKSNEKLVVFLTTGRFWAWLSGEKVEKLEYIFDKSVTEPVKGIKDDVMLGSKPILDFKISDMLNRAAVANAKAVIEAWIQVKNHNIESVKRRVWSIRMPSGYQTNVVPSLSSYSSKTRKKVDVDELNNLLIDNLASVKYLALQLHRNNRKYESYAAAIFIRSLFPDSYPTVEMLQLHEVLTEINMKLKIPRPTKPADNVEYYFKGVDTMMEVMKNQFQS